MVNTKSIKANIKRYHKLRMHKDKKFRRELRMLEEWKTNHVLDSYSSLMDDSAQADLLDYYFRDIFTGIDLSELKRTDRVQKVIDKFFSGTEMLTLALEFNAIIYETNEQLTEMLFEEMGVEALDVDAYVEACHRAEVIPALQEQLILFDAFVSDLNDTVEDSLVVASVKMAKIPARLAGFRRMHKLIAEGLRHARRLDDAQALAERIISHERAVVENIRTRGEPVFFDLE